MSKERILTIDDLPMHKDTYFFGYGIDIENPDKMARQVIELKEEKQELKKQLHEASIEIQHLIEQDIDCPSSCNKLEELKEQLEASRRVSKHHLNRELDLENQQKEFTEWLEDKLNMCDSFLDTIKSDLEEISYAGRVSGKTYIATQIMKNETAKKCYEEVLSKYKQMVGGNNDQ